MSDIRRVNVLWTEVFEWSGSSCTMSVGFAVAGM